MTVMGKEDKQPELDEEWLIFSRAVTANGGLAAGQVELAFSLVKDDQSQLERIRRLKRSPLVVFFPTVLETHLGFLVQGPYRTTPSRDNVPGKDDWNRRLVGENGFAPSTSPVVVARQRFPRYERAGVPANRFGDVRTR